MFYCCNHSFTYLELNESIDALQQVNDTVLQLIDLTDRLQMELDNITAQTVQLNTNCRASTNPSVTVICNMIPTMSYLVVINYTDVSVLCVCACACVCVCVCAHGCVCVCTCMGVCDTISHVTLCSKNMF